MNFLAPFFLLGALAIALPVMFHLIRRTTRERTVFSSLMFLRPIPPRLTKRNRLENLLLLLLRCAVLGLLALGFARPFFTDAVSETPPATPAKKVILLLDISASMRRGNLWETARRKAEAILGEMAPTDQAALYAFDRQWHRLLTFEQWNRSPTSDRAAVARNLLAAARPGWSGTHLDQALIRAADLLAEADDDSADTIRQIVLISDFQEGSQLNALQTHEWPQDIEVRVDRVAAGPTTGNAGLQLAAQRTEAEASKDPAVRVRVINAPDSTQEQFQVGWASEKGAFLGLTNDIYVPAGQSRMISLPVLETNSVADRIILRGDSDDFDNTLFVFPPAAVKASVLYFGSDTNRSPRQPLYFLERAFQETRRQSVNVIPKPPSALLTKNEVKSAVLFIVTETLAESQLPILRDQVAGGKTLLFAPSNKDSASTLSRLLESIPIPIEEGDASNYAMLGEINFRHPLFAPFADARFSDFTKIHFWRHRRIEVDALAEARVLARFDNDDVAIFEVPLGRGRVVVLASGWHPADSQLALSSKFVPLLYSLLELSGGLRPAPLQYSVGDKVMIPDADNSEITTATVIHPDKSVTTVVFSETNFVHAAAPGIYQVASAGRSNRFAVNLEAAESLTTPLPLDELERLGAPGPRQKVDVGVASQRQVQLHNNELEGRQKLWRWFIVATLAILLIETWLAGRTARRAPIQGEATA